MRKAMITLTCLFSLFSYSCPVASLTKAVAASSVTEVIYNTTGKINSIDYEDDEAIMKKIRSVMKKSGFKPGSLWNGGKGGAGCQGFANAVFKKVFQGSPGWDNYPGTLFSYSGRVNSKSIFLYSSIRKTKNNLDDYSKWLAENARPGDVLTYDSSNYGWPHSMIVYKHNKDKITIYDANRASPTNKIATKTMSYIQVYNMANTDGYTRLFRYLPPLQIYLDNPNPDTIFTGDIVSFTTFESNGATLTLQSGNQNIARITSDDKVEAINEGSVKITACVKGNRSKTLTYNINVERLPVFGIELPDNQFSGYKLIASYTLAVKQDNELYIEDVVWESSDTEIGIINEETGVFSLIAPGLVTFTATFRYKWKTLIRQITIDTVTGKIN